MKHFVRIPRDRIGALIGKDGKIKKSVEDDTGAKIIVDSTTGEVEIDYSNIKDPGIVLKVVDFVKSVGRGFSPEKAKNVLRDDYFFILLDIHDFVGKSSKRVRTMKGRIIGRGGKTRKMIEEYTGTSVSIYGDTVGIIGPLPELEIAKRAVEMLLMGSEHSTVYNYLERASREISQLGKDIDYIEYR